MIVDARELDHGTVIEGDVCVVGAGAAGITIARELLGSPLRVIVLESGGLEFDERIQSLYAGRNIGFPAYDIDTNRLRYFGGTTNHWVGHCRPLDPIDFERRAWLPHSGWPISRADLGRLGLGRAWGELLEDDSIWPEHVESGKHHCGTARMSTDPKFGVVDANCRVHGLANLYVAESAVFPTIGYANPTLTIVALSLRLADHLKQLA